MAAQLDVRGLSCPVPVVRTKQAMDALGSGALEVLVDTDTARENVTRLASREGWNIEEREESGGWRLVLEKG